MRQTNSAAVITQQNPGSPVSERYRNLRMNLQLTTAHADAKLILVTSALNGEGKSMTAANLAVTYAQAQQRVLLVDADFRNPSQHLLFRQVNASGLSQVLKGESDIEDAVKSTEIHHLQLLTTGAHSNNAYELLDIQRVEQLFEELKHRYDVILIDSPPLLDVTDAKLLASRSDGVILVVKARSTKGAQVRKAKECLENVGARILGAVINDKKE